ncbi:MAG: DUF2961 domain-containing protein [Deltaproteobacteria bacterium]|nr:DUF2961 domain-containing protein [Deltaproteobacteria bacterium]
MARRARPRSAARATCGSLGLLALGLLVGLDGCEPPPGPIDVGWAALGAWRELPVPGARRYAQGSGADAERRDYPFVASGNKDFNNLVAVCGGRAPLLYQEVAQPERCTEGIPGYLIFADDEGPGYISRIKVSIGTLLESEKPGSAIVGLADETIAIYVDDLTRPVYRGRLRDWAEGRDPLFGEPFAGWRSGTTVSYLPISFQSKVRVVLDRLVPSKLHYYHVGVQHLPAGQTTLPFDPSQVAARSGLARALLAGGGLEDPGEGQELTWIDRRLVAPPARTTPLFEIAGPGTIELLELELDGDGALASLGALDLQASWDTEPTPALEVSLGALFASDRALGELRTLPLRVTRTRSGWRLSLRLPMPFVRGARLALRNRGDAPVSLAVRAAGDRTAPAASAGRLRAQVREQIPPLVPGARHLVAEISGRGTYVGTLLSIDCRPDPANEIFPHPLNCLEGDERGTIDGEVRIRGDGTEDYFNGGWYFWNGRYAHALSAANFVQYDPKDAREARGQASLLRWHILTDAIDFERSFRLDFEVGAGAPEVLVRYASVALFYQ